MKFFMKCVLIVSLLLFGVLLGMQHANEGMKKMRGYDDPSLQGVFQITGENGDVEASVLGRKVTSHDLSEKQQQLEEFEAFNLFSSIGEKLGNGVSAFFKELLNLLGNVIGSLLDKIG